MPNKRQAKKRQAQTVHFERVPLEIVKQVAQADVSKGDETGPDGELGEAAAEAKPRARRS